VTGVTARHGHLRASPPPTLTSALHELAEQLERLRPNWQRPEIFFDLRADLAAKLRDIALSRAPQDRWRPPERRPAILLPPERERRFRALLAAKEAELEQLRRTLASAVPKIRRRRLADDRQLCFMLATNGKTGVCRPTVSSNDNLAVSLRSSE
jgi:hypothetical protein